MNDFYMRSFTWRVSKEYKRRNKIKASQYIVMTAAVIFAVFSLGLLYQIHMEQNYKIYDETLRFHVRAASDEKQEQELKLQVRDAVLGFLKETADSAQTAKNLEQQLKDKKEEICEIVAQTLKQLGFQEAVKVSVTKERFPFRRYGTVIFPAGEYHALRVDIGEAKGHNWWCAIYPELCYTSEEQFTLSGKGKEDMENALPKKEKETLAGKNIKIRFKLLEWIKKL